jgi:hypothetical protein
MRDINITYPNEIYLGDSIDIECQISEDLTGYSITAELYDRNYFLAGLQYTNEIPSGESSQIEMIDWENGEFIIHVPAGATDLMLPSSYLKITLEYEDETDKVITVYNKPIYFKPLKAV